MKVHLSISLTFVLGGGAIADVSSIPSIYTCSCNIHPSINGPYLSADLEWKVCQKAHTLTCIWFEGPMYTCTCMSPIPNFTASCHSIGCKVAPFRERVQRILFVSCAVKSFTYGIAWLEACEGQKSIVLPLSAMHDA